MQIPARFCHVALFVPNLIGYLRLVLLAAAVCTGVSAPLLTYRLFLGNLLLDGLDGIAARRLNQALFGSGALLHLLGFCQSSWRRPFLPALTRWVQSVMADGFKTPSGALAIVGLMGLPLWLWACRYMPGSLYASPFLGALVIIGRLVCASVEVWVLYAHFSGLLKQDKLDFEKYVGTQTAKQT